MLPTIAKRSSIVMLLIFIPFAVKDLSSNSFPHPSGNESAKTPNNPSKGIESALCIPVFNFNFMGEISKMMGLADKGIEYCADESEKGNFCFAIDLERMRSSLRERAASYEPPAFVPLGVSPICDDGKGVVDDGAARPPVDSTSTKPARFSIAPSPITTPDVRQGGSSSAAAFHKPIAGRGGSSGGAK